MLRSLVIVSSTIDPVSHPCVQFLFSFFSSLSVVATGFPLYPPPPPHLKFPENPAGEEEEETS
jgi:hypothetical protein